MRRIQSEPLEPMEEMEERSTSPRIPQTPQDTFELQQMNVELEEPKPQRRGFIAGTQGSLQHTIGETRADSESLAKQAGLGAVKVFQEAAHHVPGMGLLSSAEAVRESRNSLQQTQQQKEIFQETLGQLKTNNPVQRAFKATLEYGLEQIEKRLSKLNIKDAATKLNAAGATLSALAPLTVGATLIPGIALSGAGSAMRAGVNVKSAVTMVQKMRERTLGKKRYEHAQTLYGFALEHLEFLEGRHIPALAGHQDSYRALEQIRQIGTQEERASVRQQSFQMLNQLGLVGDPDSDYLDFRQNGLTRIAFALKSN